jgi:hypothetical protein
MIPLTPLHPDDQLLAVKLAAYRNLSTDVLIVSLRPGQPGSLKPRPDGTILDGHHRLKVLRERGVDVDRLPREIVPKRELPDPPVGPPHP